ERRQPVARPGRASDPHRACRLKQQPRQGQVRQPHSEKGGSAPDPQPAKRCLTEKSKHRQQHPVTGTLEPALMRRGPRGLDGSIVAPPGPPPSDRSPSSPTGLLQWVCRPPYTPCPFMRPVPPPQGAAATPRGPASHTPT